MKESLHEFFSQQCYSSTWIQMLSLPLTGSALLPLVLYTVYWSKRVFTTQLPASSLTKLCKRRANHVPRVGVEGAFLSLLSLAPLGLILCYSFLSTLHSSSPLPLVLSLLCLLHFHFLFKFTSTTLSLFFLFSSLQKITSSTFIVNTSETNVSSVIHLKQKTLQITKSLPSVSTLFIF